MNAEKICPLLKNKCLGKECALFVGDKCAFAQIAVSALAISGSVDGGFGSISQTLEVCEQDLFQLGLNKELKS